MSENKVRVGVRIRPLASCEIENGAETVVSAERNGRVRVNVPARQNTFDFDWAYGKNSEQRTIYEDTCKPLIESFFEGYNSTVFAYGQTGSGKTFTMGNDGSQSNEGMIPFAITDIFEKIRVLSEEGVRTKLELSYMEVYKEECFDLLSSQRQKCDIREGSKGDTYVEGLSHHEVSCEDDVRNLLKEVAKTRSTAKTAMNAQSSRSHAICSFVLTSSRVLSTDMENGVDTTVTSKSFLHLVDLAGSERAKKTMASGDVFNEGVNINKGLLALGNVIAALATQGSGGGSSHVPYRDSKITRILKDSLGGNSMTVMIACVSPADTNFEETLNTLRFAARASTIVNTASTNKEYDCEENSGVSAMLLQEICVLREEIRTLQSRSSQRPNSEALVGQFVKMSSFTKGILIKCLEDDVGIADDEVETARSTVTTIRKLMASSGLDGDEGDGAECSMDMDFLPPLMKLIEDLENLEKSAASMIMEEEDSSSSGRSSDASESSRSSSEMSEDDLTAEESASSSRERGTSKSIGREKNSAARMDSMDSVDAGHLADMSLREAEVNQMIHMSELCKATISQLRREVQELETEKKAAQAATDRLTAKNKAPTADTSKSVQMLKEKVKKLEEKQKELRKKEIEYAKLLQQKDKACKEVTVLKTQLQNSKRLNVENQKKQRKEAEKYAEEKKKLTLQENQSRRREIQAQEKAQKISVELSNKDRVMKSKLEEKEREIKRLKLLSDKQDKAKAQREKSAMNRSGSSQVSRGIAKKGLAKSESLQKSEVELHQAWIIKQVEAQSSRVIVSEELKELGEQRMAVQKRLIALRKERDAECALVAVSLRSEEEVQRDNDIRQLEKEKEKLTSEIAQLNGKLEELGHDLDKSRFRGINDLRESKVYLSTMFQKLTHDSVMQKRALDVKLTAQEQELAELREKLSQYEPSVAPSAPPTVTKKPRPEGLHSGAQREKIIRKGPTLSSRIGTVKARVDTNLKTQGGLKRGKSREEDSDFEDDGDSDYNPEESFFESDEEQEESVGEKQRKNSKKRSSNDSSGDDSVGSRKKSRGSSGSSGGESIGSNEDIGEPTFPLSQYNVATLKKFLKNRGLKVAGNKDALISRLEASMSDSNDENAEPSNTIPSGDSASHSLDDVSPLKSRSPTTSPMQNKASSKSPMQQAMKKLCQWSGVNRHDLDNVVDIAEDNC